MVEDPIALPWWGVLVTLPGSVIVGTAGHVYYAVEFNCLAVFVTVAFFKANWKNGL